MDSKFQKGLFPQSIVRSK